MKKERLPENLEKFFKWFRKKGKHQPFEFKSLDILSDRVQKTWPIRVIEKCTDNLSYHYLSFVLKDLNVKLSIEAFSYTPLYFIDVYPGTGKSYGSMRLYLRNHNEIVKLIKKLHKHDITGKILKKYLPDPPFPYAKGIPVSVKGVNIKTVVKRLMKLYD